MSEPPAAAKSNIDTTSENKCGPVTKEIESRTKESPEHLFEVFLEIREPTENEPPEILITYPRDYSDDILKTAVNFAYPCKISLDEQGENFTFVLVDSTGALFRYGYCRRSNREATCLCIISYYPWFETFYTILNDLSQIINTKSTTDVESFLSLLYNYKLLSLDEFHKHESKELIQFSCASKDFSYIRPDLRKLPAMLSSAHRNFAVMFSRLGPDIMLRVFSHMIFERRILFVSSKLFHLTACACGCLHMIYPMHWQSIFVPILPSTMSWLSQCTVPYIIGVPSSIFSTMNMNELGDVVVVNIDERTIESQYDDLSRFPKHLNRIMKKSVQQMSQLPGDQLAKVFLRAMAFAIGGYASGFILKNEKLDFDRDLYLEQYLGSHVHTFMSAIAHTQMFEQFSRYRTHALLQADTDVDEFDIEVKMIEKLQQNKKFKTNKKFYKILEKYVKDGTIQSSSSSVAPESSSKEPTKFKKRLSLIDTVNDRNKATNPIIEQVQTKAEKLQTAINKAGQRVASEASSVRNNFTSLEKNDIMKRIHPSTTDPAIADHHLRLSKPPHQSSTPDLLDEKSIPYERFGSTGNMSSNQLHLVNGRSSSSSSSSSSTPELERRKIDPLINLDDNDNSSNNSLLPTSIVLNVINSPLISTTNIRSGPQVHSTIKQLQSELQYKVQTFDGKRIDPREEYGEQQKEIKKLVQQFDPLDDPNYTMTSNGSSVTLTTPSSSALNSRKNSDLFQSEPVTYRSNPAIVQDRHPSIFATIPPNRVNHILQNIQSTYGTTTSRPTFRPSFSIQPRLQQQPNSIRFNPASTAPAALFPTLRPIDSTKPIEPSQIFDPLAPSSSHESTLYPHLPPPPSTKTGAPNLIDFLN